jgi:Zn-dependent protease with chaperone function
MQVLLLGLFVAVYLHDATTAAEASLGGEALPGDVWPGLGLWPVLLIVLLPKLLIGLLYWLSCMRTRKRLGTETGQRALNRLEAMTSALPTLLLGLFVADLTAGALRHLRVGLHHTVLIDELLVMLPTLLVAVWGWASYYPVDRRLREALIMRDADHGRPVYPLLSRGAYVMMQLRHQFGLLLLPLLAVFAWAELLLLLGPSFDGPLSEEAAFMLSPLGVLAIFLGAPLIIRHIWQTAPLPAGEVRNRMIELCELHNVRVRELLLWQTSGRMINAAVTGLVSKVRYILLSDGLLDQLEPRAIEAVMAHELAHVKCKHLIWMALIVVALLGTLEGGGHVLLITLAGPMVSTADTTGASASPAWTLNDPNVRMGLVSFPSLLVALLGFGWVSRRIERQADVFAVKHLAATSAEKQFDDSAKQVFDEDSVRTMVHALQRVSELNHAPTSRKSWRHGSIAWRQDHLRSLIGHPIGETSVDRLLTKVKFATLVGLVFTAALYLV